MIMSTIMEDIKHQSQAILENIKETGQSRQEVASKPERQLSNELDVQHFENLCEADEFHRSPMQVEVRYLPPHRREGCILKSIAWEKPNAIRAKAP